MKGWASIDRFKAAMTAIAAVALLASLPVRAGVKEDFQRAYEAGADGDYIMAAHYYSLVIDSGELISDEQAVAHNNRGNIYNRRQLYDKALADYDKAISLKPDYANAYNNRGSAYIDLQDFERAIADFDHAIAISPDYAEAHNNRCEAELRLGEVDRAFADCRKAIDLQPDSAAFHRTLGAVYLETKNYGKADAALSTAISLSPGNVSAWLRRAAAREALGSTEDAIADYRQALALDPYNFDAQDDLRRLESN
ncbi:MAG: hypothetical protein CMM50_00925 [Rhodospirillaceae bacterium]|nr:hypothetical protein [Rhodospirillaceae bacterium]